MTVSVITVCYNATRTIEATMKSVAEQTAVDYEHLIIDGNSSDATLSQVASLATKHTVVHSEEDNGIYDAMNKGLEMARGDYVIYLNAGDSFADNQVLQRFIDAAKASNNRAGVIYGQTMVVDENRRVLGERHLKAPENLTLKSFRNGMLVCHQAFMARRDIAPLYDLRYRLSADYEWCIRCLQQSESNVYLGEKPVIHYLNEGLTTQNHRASLLERFRIMSHYFGFFSALGHHFTFIGRYLQRRSKATNIQ